MTACLKLRIAHSSFCVYTVMIVFSASALIHFKLTLVVCSSTSLWTETTVSFPPLLSQSELEHSSAAAVATTTSESLTHTHSWVDDWLPLWQSLIVETSLFYNYECFSRASVLHSWVVRVQSCSHNMFCWGWKSRPEGTVVRHFVGLTNTSRCRYVWTLSHPSYTWLSNTNVDINTDIVGCSVLRSYSIEWIHTLFESRLVGRAMRDRFCVSAVSIHSAFSAEHAFCIYVLSHTWAVSWSHVEEVCVWIAISYFRRLCLFTKV